MVSLSPKKIKAFCKTHNIDTSKGIRLTSAQYNQMQIEASGGSVKNKTKAKQVSDKKASDGGIYSFAYTIEVIDEDTLKIKMVGKHLSKNVFDTLGLWGRNGQYAYKRAIKVASEEYTLRHRKEYQKIRKGLPFLNATVKYTFYNTHSRDSDANPATVKRLQDTFTELGLIIDDSRKYLLPDGAVDEIVTKKDDKDRYKVEAILKRVKNDN